jgi:hypothetical protein
MPCDTARFRQEIIDDYQGALLRLATLRANGEQYLLFAWLELFPFDMNLPSGWKSGARPWTVPGSNGWTCAFSATRLTTVEALDWYEAAANGNIDIGLDKGRQVSVGVAPLGPEPIHGRFCIAVDAPFTFRWRCHQRDQETAVVLQYRVVPDMGHAAAQHHGENQHQVERDEDIPADEKPRHQPQRAG